MCYFQKYTGFAPRSILSPEGLQQCLSLGTNPVCSAVPCFPHDNIVGNRLCDECKKSVLLTVCHMPESILWLISQSCWLTTRMSGRPIRATYKHVTTISLWSCSTFLFASSQYRSTHFWSCPSTLQDHATVCAWGFSHPNNFPLLQQKNTWLKHLLILFNNWLIRFAFTLSTSQVFMVKKWCGFVSIHMFDHLFPWEPYSASFQQFFYVIHKHWQK